MQTLICMECLTPFLTLLALRLPQNITTSYHSHQASYLLFLNHDILFLTVSLDKQEGLAVRGRVRGLYYLAPAGSEEDILGSALPENCGEKGGEDMACSTPVINSAGSGTGGRSGGGSGAGGGPVRQQAGSTCLSRLAPLAECVTAGACLDRAHRHAHLLHRTSATACVLQFYDRLHRWELGRRISG